MLPAGIAVDQDGRVYMADQFHRKVDVFRPASLAPEAGYFARPAAAPAAGK
jgi:sugar lactone lactonase YvrE